MVIEPFGLNGKTIKDCYLRKNNTELVIELTDGYKAIIHNRLIPDEITGDLAWTDQIEIRTEA
jgi:hypothetical protein